MASFYVDMNVYPIVVIPSAATVKLPHTSQAAVVAKNRYDCYGTIPGARVAITYNSKKRTLRRYLNEGHDTLYQ